MHTGRQTILNEQRNKWWKNICPRVSDSGWQILYWESAKQPYLTKLAQTGKVLWSVLQMKNLSFNIIGMDQILFYVSGHTKRNGDKIKYES